MSKRILIVQSDKDLAESLKQGLAPDYETQTATDMPEALTCLAQTPPDLILLDMVLTRGSGIRLLDYLLGLGRPVPPVIMIGQHPFAPESNPFRHLIAGFLPKPFHLAQLRQELERACTSWIPSEAPPTLAGNPSVLLVVSDASERVALSGHLLGAGARVTLAGSIAEANRPAEREKFDLVVCDWNLPDGTGRELMEHLRTLKSRAPVLILAANSSPLFARRLLSLGAVDLLSKPVAPELLLIALEKARFQSAPLFNGEKLSAACRATREEGRRLVGQRRHPYEVRYTADDIIGVSPAIQRARIALQQIARMESTVLISGETGTGKELFAHALHQLSRRRNGPFVAVNAAAIPEQLLESELFGYSSGAFTGAKKEGHRGKFLLADGGTLFLDEIGDLSLGLQAKLLRVLQESEVDPIGGDAPKQIDVRLVVATHRNLGMMVREGLFRSDLYFRLNVVNISIPPLRERMADLSVLAERFLASLCQRYGVQPKRFSPEVQEVLHAYSWPGNVRELRNAVEHAFVFTPGEVIYPANLPGEIVQLSKQRGAVAGRASPAERSEPEAILQALEQTGGNKVRAARLLGISRAGLYIKLKEYGFH